MNDDPDDLRLENELRTWRPMAASRELEDRIAGQLDTSPTPLPRRAWWCRLGFARPTAALGWGLASPAVAVAVALTFVRPDAGKPLPSPPSTRAEVTGAPSLSRSGPVGSGEDARNFQAANVLEAAFDEGVVSDDRQGLVRRVRYHSTDHVQWRNPRTGAEWEVSYPREDVLLVPIKAE